MNETMIRFNLVGGLTYSITGPDALETYIAYIKVAKWFDMPHDGKTVRIYLKYIVSVEWRGDGIMGSEYYLALEGLKR